MPQGNNKRIKVHDLRRKDKKRKNAQAEQSSNSRSDRPAVVNIGGGSIGKEIKGQKHNVGRNYMPDGRARVVRGSDNGGQGAERLGGLREGSLPKNSGAGTQGDDTRLYIET